MAENSTELADELHRTGSVTCCELGMSQLSENQLIDLTKSLAWMNHIK